MRFDVLGPFQATSPVAGLELPTGHALATLAWLAANVGEPIGLATLAEVVWGSPEHTARAAGAVRQIQRQLGDAVELDQRVRLVLPRESVDAVRFESLVNQGRDVVRDDPVHAARLFEAALVLWRGDPLPELDRAVAALAVIDRLHDLRLTAVEELAGIALRGPVDYALVAHLTGTVILHPDRPRLRRQLCLALYRTGRQVEALRTLEVARREVPDPSYERLQAALLRHAPELEAGEI